MFSMTGVTRPDLDVESLRRLADHYTTLADAASDANQETLGAARAVMNDNEGPAANAFNASATGSGSIGAHMGQLASAARRTATAYQSAATSGGSAQTAMKILAADRERLFWTKLAQGADLHVLNLLVQVTRTELLQLEGSGAASISNAFGNLDLPQAFTTTGADKDGRFDSAITERWADLTDEERIRALQKMADAYADANDFPRIRIQFNVLTEDPGTILWGQYTHSPPLSSLELNRSHLNDPRMINTVIHEMQHRRQYTGMDWRWPWQDVRNGMSREEAQRWSELNSDHVRMKGGPGKWDYYPPRPIEVDARRAGRDYVDDLTYEEFEEYLR